MKALLILIALCATAFAQETGGHMGGGDWGGGGGGGGYSGGGGGYSSPSSSPSWSSSSGWGSHDSSSSSSHSSWSWSSSSPSKPSTYDWSRSGTTDYDTSHHYGDGPSINPAHLFFGVGLLIVLAIIVVLFWKSFTETRDTANYVNVDYGPVRIDGPAYGNNVDVTVLRVAIDGRARKFIQAELKQIAATCDTATAEGRVAMLSRVAVLLRKVKDAWVYGGAHNEQSAPIGRMKPIYDRHVDDARTRFERETVTNVQGQKRRDDAGDLAWRSDEGEGLILVSIILAARGELYTVSSIGDGEDLRKALEAIFYIEEKQLVAVDVVWMPAEEDDRMSSIELTAKYPRPELIPIRGALVGKAFCAYCAGPFPAELVSCPHCGAPARERAA
jgi:uncharacterized membrane protein